MDDRAVLTIVGVFWFAVAAVLLMILLAMIFVALRSWLAGEGEPHTPET